MNKHIEFSTSPRRSFARFSRGNPLHDGRLPSRRVDSPVVRIDGEPTSFSDESFAERLHRTLREVRQRQSRIGINCRRFAALMLEPETASPLPACYIEPDYERPVTPEDRPVDSAVILGNIEVSPRCSSPRFYDRHTIIPAHLPDRPYYVHKLGFDGPVCLSGLADAMAMYACELAYLPRALAG